MSAIPSLQADLAADYAAWREAMLQWQKEGEQCIKLRDHFAAAALTGLLSRQQWMPDECVPEAYRLADAMLREREQARQKMAESDSSRAVGPERDKTSAEKTTGSVSVTLTDAEREAVEEMLHLIATRQTDYQREAHTLRKLLERLA